MKYVYASSVLLLLTTFCFGQNNNETMDIAEVYVLHFDNDDVQDWTKFNQFISNITQAEDVYLNEKENEYHIETYRVLDPKIIEGKLVKYGVDYFNLIQIVD